MFPYNIHIYTTTTSSSSMSVFCYDIITVCDNQWFWNNEKPNQYNSHYIHVYGNTIYIYIYVYGNTYLQDIYWITDIGNHLQY